MTIDFILTVTHNDNTAYLQSIDNGLIFAWNIHQAKFHKTAEEAELRKIYLQARFPEYTYNGRPIYNV